MKLILLFQKYWSFNSQILCNAWISVDQISCTASIVHLCMISIDRYLAISRPFSYERFRTYKFMAVLITIAWTIAIMIPLPPLIFFGHEDVLETKQCLVSQNKLYTVYSTFTAFYLPLSVMCFVYLQLFKKASEISRSTKRNCSPYSPSVTRSTKVTRNDQSQYRRAGTESPSFRSETPQKKISNTTACSSQNNRFSSSSISTLTQSRNYMKRTLAAHKNNFNNETKAARTLGFIMGAFCFCWIPFFVISLLRPFMEVDLPPWVDSVLLWLGYSNSCLNPIIYGLLNQEFRTPYYLILCCRFKNINRHCNLALNPQISSLNENDLNLPPETKRGSIFPRQLLRNSVSMNNLSGEKPNEKEIPESNGEKFCHSKKTSSNVLMLPVNLNNGQFSINAQNSANVCAVEENTCV